MISPCVHKRESGEGELGLRELFAVLPADRVYAIEVPLRTEAKAGIDVGDRLAKCVAATRRLLTAAHGEGVTA
jgi:hypothetical protein